MLLLIGLNALNKPLVYTVNTERLSVVFLSRRCLPEIKDTLKFLSEHALFSTDASSFRYVAQSPDKVTVFLLVNSTFRLSGGQNVTLLTIVFKDSVMSG